MIWWLLPKGTTRSHSELGRETFARQWYFSLSCGRVGHCQIFYILFITVLFLYLFIFPPIVAREIGRFFLSLNRGSEGVCEGQRTFLEMGKWICLWGMFLRMLGSLLPVIPASVGMTRRGRAHGDGCFIFPLDKLKKICDKGKEVIKKGL